MLQNVALIDVAGLYRATNEQPITYHGFSLGPCNMVATRMENASRCNGLVHDCQIHDLAFHGLNGRPLRWFSRNFNAARALTMCHLSI